MESSHRLNARKMASFLFKDRVKKFGYTLYLASPSLRFSTVLVRHLGMFFTFAPVPQSKKVVPGTVQRPTSACVTTVLLLSTDLDPFSSSFSLIGRQNKPFGHNQTNHFGRFAHPQSRIIHIKHRSLSWMVQMHPVSAMLVST